MVCLPSPSPSPSPDAWIMQVGNVWMGLVVWAQCIPKRFLPVSNPDLNAVDPEPYPGPAPEFKT